MLRAFDVMLRHKGFDLVVERPAAPLPPVLMDAAGVAQAVHNLLDNAVKYSGDGRRIVVRLRRAGGFATIAVQDAGLGIGPEDQAKVFDRFFRVSTGLVHDVRGSGLGLCIVNHIVKAHGGDVTLESDVGRGSTFTIRLPLPPEPEPAAAPAVAAAAATEARP